MSAPLTIKFATDHSAAKSGMQDLAASVVSNMVKVSDALNTGIQANGGYAATVKTLATNVAGDFMNVANAGLKAANDTNYSGVAIGAAVGKAAAETKTASVAMQGAWAVAASQAQFAYGVVRNEASATLTMLRNSPAVMSTVTAVAGLAALVVALELTAAAGRAAEERIAELVKIGTQAASLGVGTTFLQGLTGQAKDLGMAADVATRALEHARDASTTRIGEGKNGPSSPIEDQLARHVKAGNISQGDLDRFQAADSQEARARVILSLYDQLIAKGSQLAAFDITKSFFGGEFETKLRSGIDMIGMVRRSLDGLGAAGGDRVFSEAEIQRAQALDDRVKEINNKLADGMRPIMQDIALYQQQQIGGWLDIKDQIADCIIAAGKFYLKIKELGSAFGNLDIFKQMRDFMDRNGLIDHEEGKRIEAMLNGGRALAKVGAPKDGDTQPSTDAPLSLRVSPKKDTSRSLPSAGGGSSRGQDTDSVESYITSLKKSAAALQAEVEAFGKSNAEKAEAIALAKANEIATANGTKLTEDQTARIKEAATAASTYKDKLLDLEQAQQQAAETARYFGNAISSSFADAILEGKSFSSILQDLEKQLARAALQAAFTGQGPLAGILGLAPAASTPNAVGGLGGLVSSLFGGFRANGGPMQAGRAYTVGEMGQELFVPNQDGRMVPIARGGGFGNGGSGPITVYNYAGDQVSATPQRRSDGGVELWIDRLDSGLAERVGSGRGDLAAISPGMRNLRG